MEYKGQSLSGRDIATVELLEEIKAYFSEDGAALNALALGGVNATSYALKTDVDKSIADLVGTAPESLNTIQELAAALKNNKDIVDTLDAAITAKADKTDLAKYLPTAGGTMTGGLALSNNKFIEGMVRNDTTPRKIFGINNEDNLLIGRDLVIVNGSTTNIYSGSRISLIIGDSYSNGKVLDATASGVTVYRGLTVDGVSFSDKADKTALDALSTRVTNVADSIPTLQSLMGTTAIGSNQSYIFWNGTKWETQLLSKKLVGLGNVENTALSTWSGTANINTVGTITTGTWHGTAIDSDYIGNLSWKKITSDKPTTLDGYGILNAYTKLEMDTAFANYLKKSGGKMTGDLIFGFRAKILMEDNQGNQLITMQLTEAENSHSLLWAQKTAAQGYDTIVYGHRLMLCQGGTSSPTSTTKGAVLVIDEEGDVTINTNLKVLGTVASGGSAEVGDTALADLEARVAALESLIS